MPSACTDFPGSNSASRTSAFLRLVCACLAWGLLAPHAWAQDVALPPFHAHESRIATLEEELQAMRGRIEQLEFRLQQAAKERERMQQQRLSQKAEAQSIKTAQTIQHGQNTQAKNTQAAADMSPNGLYQQAKTALKARDYSSAQAAFEQFLVLWPEHNLTSNVYYWLAEIYYAKADFTQAAVTFMEGYTREPEGRKAPDSLLKLGMALARTGKKQEACVTFQRLQQSFPKLPAHISPILKKEVTAHRCTPAP